MDVWKYESVGELSDNTENARQWWFYLPQLLYVSMPWTPLWVVGCVLPFSVRANRSKARSEASARITPLFFPLIWWGATVVFFSFLNQKKNAYLLPALPAQAMMIGQALAALLGWVRETKFKGGAGAMVAAQAAIGVGFAIGLGVLIARGSGRTSAGITIAAVGLPVALIPLLMMLLRRPQAWLVTQAMAYTVLMTLGWRHFIIPSDDSRSARPVGRQIVQLCKDPQYTVLVSRLPEEVAVYLPIEMQYGFGPKVLIVVDDAHGAHDRAVSGKNLSISEPRVESFQGIVPDGKVVGVRRIPVQNVPPDYRWKVYELTVERRGFASATLRRERL
jgi:4-amino-4-deoxy-L-arabinose transferase-like glycosyltransferase